MSYPNVDKYGHCVICHKNLLVERVVDQQVITMFTPDKQETEFMLDDGTRMRVSICRECKEGEDLHSESKQIQIMESVVNGWQLEIDSLVNDEKRPEWTFDRGKKHMDVYSKKKILCYSDGMAEHVIKDRIKKVKELKAV